MLQIPETLCSISGVPHGHPVLLWSPAYGNQPPSRKARGFSFYTPLTCSSRLDSRRSFRSLDQPPGCVRLVSKNSIPCRPL
jgi:hypothetical protein